MPIIAYNKFYSGISQDNKVYQEWQYAYGENIDWMSDWYWLQLSKKSNKQVLTWTNAINTIISPFGSTYFRAWWDGWVIYTENSIDNTPAKILSNSWNILNILYANGYLWMIIVDPNNQTLWYIAKIQDHTFTELSLDIWVSLYDIYRVPPMLNLPNNTFAVWWISLIICDNTTNTINSIPSWYITWMSLHWTTLMTYSNNWMVYYWQKDTTDATHKTYKIIWQIKIPTFIDRVTSFGWSDYVLSVEWRIFEVAWQWFNEILTPSYSKRLNDSSVLSSKLNFKLANAFDNQTINSLWSEVILTWNDTYRAWLYIYWNLFAWLPNWLHKIVWQNYNYTNFDTIYTSSFRWFDNKLLYSYKSGATYWIDYIDFNWFNTYKDWFILTPVENCNTNIYKKKIQEVKIITSNTSWNNYIKLYIRYNWWSWNLLRTINNTADTIERTTINTSWKEFLDIQFKVEFHNDAGLTNSPILHELAFEYETIQE